MAVYYQLRKKLTDVGYVTKGTGDGQWKAIAPTIRFSFTNKGFGCKSENEETVINNCFIESIDFADDKLIVTNKLGETIEWKISA